MIFQLFRYPSLNEALGMAAAVIPAGITIAMQCLTVKQYTAFFKNFADRVFAKIANYCIFSARCFPSCFLMRFCVHPIPCFPPAAFMACKVGVEVTNEVIYVWEYQIYLGPRRPTQMSGFGLSFPA